jgi:hypothetical protein
VLVRFENGARGLRDHWPGLRRAQERFVAGGQRGRGRRCGGVKSSRTSCGSGHRDSANECSRKIRRSSRRPRGRTPSSRWTSGRVERCIHQRDSRHLFLHRGGSRARRSPRARSSRPSRMATGRVSSSTPVLESHRNGGAWTKVQAVELVGGLL